VARFRFPLQPALDAALAHERAAHAALISARVAIDRARVARDAAECLERALRSSTPDDVRRRIARCAEAEAAARTAVATRAQAAGARRALETLRARRCAEHVRVAALREDRELDESNARCATGPNAHSDRR